MLCRFLRALQSVAKVIWKFREIKGAAPSLSVFTRPEMLLGLHKSVLSVYYFMVTVLYLTYTMGISRKVTYIKWKIRRK